MSKKRSNHLEGCLSSSQSEQFKKLSVKALIGWEKAGFPKKPVCVWTCKYLPKH